MNQFISLEEAISMTTLYRKEKDKILAPEYQGKNILALSETFDRGVIDTLLAKPDCVKLRVYYGMSEDLQVHAIVVPVNAKNEDILPVGTGVGDGEGDIVEQGYRCPEDCPPRSPLNP